LAYETELQNAPPAEAAEYIPPCRLVLERLGISEADLKQEKVTVSARFLLSLIRQFARAATFDPEWYAAKYPDVEGAVLVGDIPSLQEHFVTSGYVEGRLPHELPFDPGWYHDHYKDIAQAYARDDVAGMRSHYLTGGYYEGRVGTKEALPLIEEWVRP
jgi:hypothetical protein